MSACAAWQRDKPCMGRFEGVLQAGWGLPRDLQTAYRSYVCPSGRAQTHTYTHVAVSAGKRAGQVACRSQVAQW